MHTPPPRRVRRSRRWLAAGVFGLIILGFAPPRAASAAPSEPAPPGHTTPHPAGDERRARLAAGSGETVKGTEPETVPGELMVQFAFPEAESGNARSLSRAGVARTVGSSAGTTVVSVPPGQLEAARRALEADPAVALVQPNYVRHASGVPTDPLYSDQAPELSLIRAPKAWDMTKGAAVKVAILDSGVDLDHPDLKARIAVAERFIGGTAADTGGHGTAVAGIIAASANNGQGISGVAPNVQLVSLKILNNDGATTDQLIDQALKRALALDVDVVNMSFGGYGENSIIEADINKLLDAGTLVVASAGNDGGSVQFPASVPGVVAVGATDTTGEVAWFSNHGPALAVVAPGIGVTSTKLTAGTSGTYGQFTGTSFATAYVSGVAALRARSVAGVHGYDKGYDLMRTAQDRGVPGFDTSYGYGIIDAFAALGAGQTPNLATAGSGDTDATLDHATAIGTHATASITPATDEDWFSFQVTTPGLVAVQVTPPAFAGTRTLELDPQVELYNSDHQLVDFADDDSSGKPETVKANALPGTFYLRVGNFGPSAGPGPYAVDVTQGGALEGDRWLQSGPYDNDSYPVRRDHSVLADINGDGKPDLLSTLRSDADYPISGILRTRLGLGDGTFASATELPSQPFSYLVDGDFNGDDIADTIVAAQYGDTRVFWGSPSGLTAGPLLEGRLPSSAVAVDLDGDGDQELVAHTTLNAVTLMEWNGSTFTVSPVDTVPEWGDLVTGDFDGNGTADVIWLGPAGYRLSRRTAGVWSTTTVPYDFTNLNGALAADLTGDGKTDLAVTWANNDESTSLVFVQQAGTLQPGTEAPIIPGTGLFLGDVDGDGHEEIVRPANTFPLRTDLLTYSGGHLQGTMTLSDVGGGISQVEDVDGDGRSDLLQTGGASAVSVWHQGPPAESDELGAPWVKATTPSPGAGGVSLTANVSIQAGRDLDEFSVISDNVWLMEGRSGELVPAALSFDWQTDTMTLNPTASLLPSTAYTLVVAGVQEYQGPNMPTQLIGFTTATGPMPGISVGGNYQPVVGDFNGDDSHDVFWYSNGASDAQWLGSPAGFRSLGSFAGWPTGMRPLLLDMDGDGYDDFLAYTPGTANGSDYIVPGDDSHGQTLKGFFQVTGTYIPLGGDFDGDGYDDLLWYGPGGAGDSIWFGGPVSSSPWRKRTLTINGTYRPVVGDFNGDQYDDIFWHAPGGAADGLWKGGPGGTFTSTTYNVNATYSMYAGDYDGNGFDDLFFYAPGITKDAMWSFGPSGTSSRYMSVNATYRPASGDFDGDGFDDLMFYGPGTSTDSMWWGTPTGARPL